MTVLQTACHFTLNDCEGLDCWKLPSNIFNVLLKEKCLRRALDSNLFWEIYVHKLYLLYTSKVQQNIEQLQTPPTMGVTINKKSTTTEPPP